MAAKKTKTATRTSTSLARAPRAAAPIIVRETRTVQAPKKKHSGRKGKSTGGSSEKQLFAHAIGGLIAGFIDKSATTLPTIPMLGKMGTLAVAAHFVGKGQAGIITDVRNAAAAIAGYEMGATGKIAGDAMVR